MRWPKRIAWTIITALFLRYDINTDLLPLGLNGQLGQRIYTLAPKSHAYETGDPLQKAIKEFKSEFEKADGERESAPIVSEFELIQILFEFETKIRQLLYGRISSAKRVIAAFNLINERYIFPFALRLGYLVEVNPEGFDRDVKYSQVFTLHRIIRHKIKHIDGDEIKGYFVHEITPFEQRFLGRLGWSWAQSDYIVVSADRIQQEDKRTYDYLFKEGRALTMPKLLLELFPSWGGSILRDSEFTTQIEDLDRQIYQIIGLYRRLQWIELARRIELQENNIFNHEAEHKRLRRKFKLKKRFRDSELSESLAVCRSMIEEDGDPFIMLLYELLKALDGDVRAWGFLSRLTGFPPQMPKRSKKAALNKLNTILKELQERLPTLTKEALVNHAREIYNHAYSELMRYYVVGLRETPSDIREIEAGL